MDAKLMKFILSSHLIQSAELCHLLDPPHRPWLLLHDNDKKFTSGLVREFLHNSGITCIEFPPYSPDLNPIENLWATLARAVEQYQCPTMESLQDAVSEEWKKLNRNAMRTLAHSMPSRCKAVIEANGCMTKY